MIQISEDQYQAMQDELRQLREFKRRAMDEDWVACDAGNVKVGSIVRLRSGGPPMTVLTIDSGDVQCAINTEHYWDAGSFPIECLMVRAETDELADAGRKAAGK